MKSMVKPVPNGLSIDLDIKDLYGNETLTVDDAKTIMDLGNGYVDGDFRQLIIPVRKC